jgi:PBP superfamily domain
MWDPVKMRKIPHPAWVAVSQVNNLVNEVVQVTWRNFTPSSQVTYVASSTDYPVMVAECKGTHPTRQSQCFGADNGGVQGSASAFGPMNTAYATTSPNGTGIADIQLLTAAQAPQLGCNKGSPCSLVIEPAQGGNPFVSPPACNDHSLDPGLTAIGSSAFTSLNGQCSWRDRIVVPLHFAPTPTDCRVRNPNFTVIGSPMLARAMDSWQSALCSISKPMSIQYDSAQNEPVARADFLLGTNDVALTTLPAASNAISKHEFVYAPVAISAESIAYWIDNPVTGQPIPRLRLDARLVAKLLTQSYNFESQACGNGFVPVKVLTCNNAVDSDPVSLFADREFQQLNRGVGTVGDNFQIPTVLSGASDMTWELTRWVAAAKNAKAFVDGTFDPWGSHVNTNYLNMQLPTDTLNAMDPFPVIASRYVPWFPLSAVAQFQVNNWYPATEANPDTTGNHPRLPTEIPGNRALFAIIDQGDAAAFQLPVAQIQNAAGRFVGPAKASMTAALKDMSTASNKVTQEINVTGKVAAKANGAYPLTMVIYAMVPTNGIGKNKAAKIAQWLDFLATTGQHPGTAPGELPPGYLPLTTKMRAQTLDAATLVLHQRGNPKPKAKATTTPTASASATASPAASATPSPTPTASSPTVTLGYDSNPATSGIARYAVPALLIAGALLAVGGSFALIAGRSGSGSAIARLRRLQLSVRLPGRKKP